MNLALALTYLFTGLLFLVIAYLLLVRRRLDLLANYDHRRVADPAGLARFTGLPMLGMGVAACGLAAIVAAGLVPPAAGFWVHSGAVVACVVLTMYVAFGGGRYMKP
ncbi:MAG: hypothetical protein OHK0039_15630 [Bacteroidia bacterium]